MAFIDAVKYKVGRELKERIHFGITAGAKASLADYRKQKLNKPEMAIYNLRRAVDMPYRKNYMIDEFKTYMIASTDSFLAGITNVTQANQFLIECVNVNPTVTPAELSAELNGHLTYAQNVVTQLQANLPNYTAFVNGDHAALTQADWDLLDQLATNLENHYSEDIVRLWNFKVDHTSYVNIFGVTGDY